jgi:hypothetical protein
VPWAQKELVDVNGQKWDPKVATITVLEGPEIPIHRLSLGRGWPLAEKQGEDVTTRVIGEARQAVSDGSAYREPAASHASSPSESLPPAEDYPSAAPSAADPFSAGVELAGLLGSDAARLMAAWRSVSARTSGLSPSETLAVAERELAES